MGENNQTILVVGANGFIGYHLIKRMESLDINIIGADIHINHLKEFEQKENIEVCQVNFAEKVTLFDEKHIDYVVNLAAFGHGHLLSQQKEIDFMPIYNNIRVAENLFKISIKSGVRYFIQMSSASIYGNDNIIGNEMLCPNPMSPYAVSKNVMEYIGKIYSGFENLNVVTFRAYNVYGYNKFAKKYGSNLIHNLITYSLNNKNAVIYADLSFKRDYIYVEDVIDAIIYSIFYKLESGIYNLGTGVAYSINEIWQHINSRIGSTGKLVSLQRRYFNVPEYSCADINKLLAKGFKSNTSLEEGIEKIITNIKGMEK